MKKSIFVSLTIFLFIAIIIMGVKNGLAYDLKTAQEAYDMVSSGQAKIIDVRTLEESVFVGSPALEPEGDPIAYLIPWKIFNGIDENGGIKLITNSDFDALVNQTFGDDKAQPLITMCAIGFRSSFAAERLEELGFTNVYEIDNEKETIDYPGGFGGFQGSSYGSLFDGYKGYPGRLENGASDITLETVTDNIDSENDSVSWMDTGLPITHKNDPNKIPKIKKNTSNTTQSKSLPIIPFINNQWFYNFNQLPLFSNSLYQSMPLGSMYQFGQQLSSFMPYNLSQMNRLFSTYSNILDIQRSLSCEPVNELDISGIS